MELPARVPRPKEWRHPRILSEHAFDKLRALDCTFAEFDIACTRAEVIDELAADDHNKELLLTLEWIRPLHVVVVVDEAHAEERVVTVYEPLPELWSADFRRRR